MRWSIGITFIFALVVGYLFWQNLSVPKTTGLVDGKLHPCPKSPNCVCCCHNDEAHYIAPLPLSSGDTLDKIQTFLETNYNAKVIKKEPNYLHVVVTTQIFRFKDDLEFAVDKKRGVVLVRSASRVGYSDGGVNRARIEALRTYLTQVVTYFPLGAKREGQDARFVRKPRSKKTLATSEAQQIVRRSSRIRGNR